METFTTARNFIDNPQFTLKRHQSLKNLNLDAIDTPIVDIISNLSQLSYCYTLQCCWGHFIHEKQLYQTIQRIQLFIIVQPTLHYVSIPMKMENVYTGILGILFRSILTTFNLEVRIGFGKNISIPSQYKLNLTDFELKTQLK